MRRFVNGYWSGLLLLLSWWLRSAVDCLGRALGLRRLLLRQLVWSGRRDSLGRLLSGHVLLGAGQGDAWGDRLVLCLFLRDGSRRGELLGCRSMAVLGRGVLGSVGPGVFGSGVALCGIGEMRSCWFSCECLLVSLSAINSFIGKFLSEGGPDGVGVVAVDG